MTGIRKRIAERRERNMELGKADAKNRCGFCKRELPKNGIAMRWNDPAMYCNADCLKDQEEREKVMR